jgi:hypothetical protein
MPNTVSVFKVLNLKLRTYEGYCANLLLDARINKAKELVLNLKKRNNNNRKLVLHPKISCGKQQLESVP